jgi:MinD superfamily P-loop ATPase
MNEIVILSGKGGTGKTSVAASLAILAGKEAVIADCDVDAANMHLLLEPDFKEGTDFYSGELAVIDREACTSCGLCMEKCRFNAISEEAGAYTVNNLDCEGCGYCALVCPSGAIAMVPRKTGKLYISQTRAGSCMVHATMLAGAENSGKLVARVRQEAGTIAEREGLEYIIVDGSPGLGCPVMASLSGASLVLLVTEPTVSSIHDMARLNKVIRNFRIETACIINKHDLNHANSETIREFLKKEGIMHLADIPFDDSVARSMSRGETVAETDSVSGEVMRTLWKKIKTGIFND